MATSPPTQVSSVTKHAELKQKAEKAAAGFKLPAYWILVFGWSLGMCAGMVNVVAFNVFGDFVSHVTGGTSNIGIGLENLLAGEGDRGQDTAPLRPFLLVFAFFVGAFLCGLMIDKNQVHFGGKAWYGAALLGNSVMLASGYYLAGLSETASEVASPKYIAALLVAAACGLQNAMCTNHFGAVVRTTHVTGTMTDIGSILGRMTMIMLRHGCKASSLNVLERAELGVDARKLLVLGPMWCFFLVGCIFGALLHNAMGTAAFLVPAGVTFTEGLLYTFFRQCFKEQIKRAMQERIVTELADVEESLERTAKQLQALRSMRNLQGDPLGDLGELETDVVQLKEAVQQVETEFGQTLEEEVEGSRDVAK